MTIKDLKSNSYFKLVKKDGSLTNKVYVKIGYDRSSKRYLFSDFEDICSCHTCKPNQEVSTDFIF